MELGGRTKVEHVHGAVRVELQHNDGTPNAARCVARALSYAAVAAETSPPATAGGHIGSGLPELEPEPGET